MKKNTQLDKNGFQWRCVRANDHFGSSRKDAVKEAILLRKLF